MEGSSGASSNESGAQSQEFQPPIIRASPEVKERRGVLAKKIGVGLNESKAILEVMSAKLTLWHRLKSEQIPVIIKLNQLLRLWISTNRNRNYSVSENKEGFHRFTEIEEQVQVLSNILHEYHNKLSRAGGIFKDFVRDFQSHTTQCSEAVFQVHTLSDLEQVQMPNLEWIEGIPDPEIEILADEWEKMQLDWRISHCLNLLLVRMLIAAGPEAEILDELENM